MQRTSFDDPNEQTFGNLLTRASMGDGAGKDQAWAAVYGELHKLAEGFLRRERASHTLQATALINEAYMKLVGSEELETRSRAEFYSLAARAMRNILVDHARARARIKRGGGAEKFSLKTGDGGKADIDTLEMMALDEALKELATLDQRKARLVELRFFGGLTMEQASDLLGIARATAARDWRFASAWLSSRVREDPE